MRPPEFTGGNFTWAETLVCHVMSFNEAAGIHRRKRYAHVREGFEGWRLQ